MGGPGSGGGRRWVGHVLAGLVEHCQVMAYDAVAHAGVGSGPGGRLLYRVQEGGKALNGADWRADPGDDGEGFVLRFPRRLLERGWNAEQRIAISSTATNGGGRRQCFLCPLASAPKCLARRRRARRLYLPSDGDVWACRWCHKLSYRLAQRGKKRADAEDRAYAQAYGITIEEAAARHKERGWGP